jgi:hypothetical protein
MREWTMKNNLFAEADAYMAAGGVTGGVTRLLKIRQRKGRHEYHLFKCAVKISFVLLFGCEGE